MARPTNEHRVGSRRPQGPRRHRHCRPLRPKAPPPMAAPASTLRSPATPPLREQELDAQGRAYATGRRKDAVARVWLKPGSGKIMVNGREQEVYFARPTLRLVINQPFGVPSAKASTTSSPPSRAAGFRARPARSSTASPRRCRKFEPDAARGGQGRRLPHPRQPRGRAQEVRPRQGPQELPVLQALIDLR